MRALIIDTCGPLQNIRIMLTELNKIEFTPRTKESSQSLVDFQLTKKRTKNSSGKGWPLAMALQQ